MSGVATSAGFRDMGAAGMAYLPTTYAGKLNRYIWESLALSDITNTNYQGEITEMGQSVIIRSIPDFETHKYYKGQNIQFDNPLSAPVTLNIDQALYWAFNTDAIDDKQTDIKTYTNQWTAAAGKQTAQDIEVQVYADVYADAESTNKGATAGYRTGGFNLGVEGGTAVEITPANALRYLIMCQAVCDERAMPNGPGERFMLIPPWFKAMIEMSDVKSASMMGDATSVARNGKLGILAQFNLFETNLLPVSHDSGGVDCTNIIFGTKDAITFATQLIETDNDKNPFGFGRLFKGLQVFGYKTILPRCMGVLFAKQGTLT